MSDDRHTEITRELMQIRETVQRIDIAIRGNGKPGLSTRVALLEAWRAGASRLVWLVIGSATACLGSVALLVAKLLIDP